MLHPSGSSKFFISILFFLFSEKCFVGSSAAGVKGFRASFAGISCSDSRQEPTKLSTDLIRPSRALQRHRCVLQLRGSAAGPMWFSNSSCLSFKPLGSVSLSLKYSPWTSWLFDLPSVSTQQSWLASSERRSTFPRQGSENRTLPTAPQYIFTPDRPVSNLSHMISKGQLTLLPARYRML